MNVFFLLVLRKTNIGGGGGVIIAALYNALYISWTQKGSFGRSGTQWDSGDIHLTFGIKSGIPIDFMLFSRRIDAKQPNLSTLHYLLQSSQFSIYPKSTSTESKSCKCQFPCKFYTIPSPIHIFPPASYPIRQATASKSSLRIKRFVYRCKSLFV